MAFYVYIMTNKPRGTLYCGQTDDINRRAWEHRNRLIKGFTYKYNCQMLVWYAGFDTREAAIDRERQIKNWTRAWKIDLVEKTNPEWRDLATALI
ncbi:hypothetical protein HY29_12360 [Hyphomonas beringensis]|uniref:GIY-YIG domain-containing protein n=1 Tax=Hyphomonas beringensis TaxID=1280946 RepID=A0A062UAI9_9PROT|nr:GIY-YIG nuclease family protein [Hyphomonas beringensis]KCZ55322.1 hypothetical protein HY29_12360 [Hyphomonas beringensis]